MLDSRWYKILFDLIENKTRTLLIILSIAVGLFAIGTIISARETLSTDLTRSFAAINPSSGVMRTVELFNSDFVQAMRSVKGVKEVDARRVIEARGRMGSGDWFDIILFVVDDYNKIKINKISPILGAWPPPDHEILIERSALPVMNAQLGDTLLIELSNEKRRELRISGTTHDLAQPPAQFDNTPYGYISLKTVEWLGLPYGFNQLEIVSQDQTSKAAAQEVINRVKDRAEHNGYTIPLMMTAEPGSLPLNDILQAILMLMGLLGLLSLFLSIFLIINTISALLAQQRRQIGVMKAIGANSFQIISMYLIMVLAYGIAALLLSIPLSIIGSNLLCRVMASLFNFDLSKIAIPISAIAAQIITGIFIPIGASLYPFLTNIQVSAADALSIYNQGQRRGHKDLIDQLISGAHLWFARFILQRPVVLSLRNTFQNKGRLLLTLITLTLGGSIFISVFSVRSSIFTTLNSLMALWNFDTLINFEQNYPVEKIENEAFKNRSVSNVDIWIQIPARSIRPDGSESEVIYMFAPKAGSLLVHSPDMIAGRWITPGDENALVVNGLFVKDEGARLGDTIMLKLNGKKHPFKIVGISMGFGASMIYANYDYIARITDKSGKAGSVLIRFNGLSDEALAQTVQSVGDHFKAQGLRVVSTQTMKNELGEIETGFNILIILLMFMATLLALVGGLGLMGTMTINVLERTREIGILRAIGAPNRGVAMVFIQEGVTIGIISWASSVLCAFPLSKLLGDAVGNPLVGSPLKFSYSYEGAAAWLVIVVVLSALASFLPARNASKLTVREVLAYE